LDTTVAVDTFVEFVILIVALLTSLPLIYREDHLLNVGVRKTVDFSILV
jgi:hypothetical protein